MNTNPTPDALADLVARLRGKRIPNALQTRNTSSPAKIPDPDCIAAADSLETFHAKPVVGEDDPCPDNEHCCCCGPGDTCCDCGQKLIDLERDVALARWTDFLDANPDDLTSPEDLPDHALVTFEQFYEMARDVLPRIPAALQSPPPVVSGDEAVIDVAHRLLLAELNEACTEQHRRGILRLEDGPVNGAAAVRAICNALAAVSTPPVVSGDDPDEAYELGKRDGFSEAVQQIDMRTGGDGEYRYCLGAGDDQRHCPDPDTMINRIVERFDIKATRAFGAGLKGGRS